MGYTELRDRWEYMWENPRDGVGGPFYEPG